MAIDKQLIQSRFARHYADYQQYAVVQRRIAIHLSEAISRYVGSTSVHSALEIGMGTGFLSRRLANLYPEAQWLFNDLVPEAEVWMPEGLKNAQTLMGDIEHLSLPDGLSLIASASALQWLRDLPAFFEKAAQALDFNAVLAFSSFGPKHMQQLRQVTGQGLNYFNLDEVQEMLRASGFRVLYCHEWVCDEHFSSGRHILEHLRRTGVNSTAAQMWTPRTLLAFCRQYESLFCLADGRLPLTYHPYFCIAQHVGISRNSF